MVHSAAMANGETTTPVRETQADDPSKEALLALRDLQPVLERLGRRSASNRVLDAVDHIRRAVLSKLEEKNNREPEPRVPALMHWARVHGIYGNNPFQVQGTIIKRSVPWMAVMAGEMFQMEMSTAISLDALKTAGYYAIKGCVWAFDPSIHGDDFEVFARPFVCAALRHCLQVGRIDIAEKPSMAFLRSLPGADSPAAVPVASADRQPDCIPATPAPVRTPQQPVAAVLPEDASPAASEGFPPAPVPSHQDPPAIHTSAPALTPEEEAEHKRMRRFCRWAKDTHQVAVSQDQFDQAVGLVAQKFHPLAKSTVDHVDVPSSFRGGKSAVRHEAVRLLPERVREFDPAGGEHFNQFLTVWLAAELKAFVAGNGKKKKET